MFHRALVGPGGRHGVERIRHRNDARLERDVLSRSDRPGSRPLPPSWWCFIPGMTSRSCGIVSMIAAPFVGVALHDLELFFRERRRLPQDPVVDADLADVVEQRRQADLPHVFGREPHLPRHLGRVARHPLGVAASVRDLCASIAAASARMELMKSSWFSRAARFRFSIASRIDSLMRLKFSERSASSAVPVDLDAHAVLSLADRAGRLGELGDRTREPPRQEKTEAEGPPREPPRSRGACRLPSGPPRRTQPPIALEQHAPLGTTDRRDRGENAQARLRLGSRDARRKPLEVRNERGRVAALSPTGPIGKRTRPWRSTSVGAHVAPRLIRELSADGLQETSASTTPIDRPRRSRAPRERRPGQLTRIKGSPAYDARVACIEGAPELEPDDLREGGGPAKLPDAIAVDAAEGEEGRLPLERGAKISGPVLSR